MGVERLASEIGGCAMSAGEDKRKTEGARQETMRDAEKP
jgi:hypothetical protein